ncbi:MAG TPA: tetratricopeptide repeat protein [Candidatus Eisenbacteria bacterium]
MSVLGAVVIAGLLGFMFLRSQATTENAAAGKLAQAEIMFWQGYYARAYDMAQLVVKQYPRAQSGLEAHRVAGDAAYWRGEPGDFQKAADEYRTYLQHGSSSLVAQGVRRSLAYALESDGGARQARGDAAGAASDFREAAATYDGLVGVFADRESSAEFLYAAARCDRQLGQTEEAVKRLKRLLDEYGETTTANRARITLAEITAGAR